MQKLKYLQTQLSTCHHVFPTDLFWGRTEKPGLKEHGGKGGQTADCRARKVAVCVFCYLTKRNIFSHQAFAHIQANFR